MDFNELTLNQKPGLASRIIGNVVNVLLILALLALIAVLVVTNMFALCRVDGESMNPTLDNLQLVMVERHKSEIRRGDVIVFTKTGLTDSNGNRVQFIKRTVAVAGDTFSFARNGNGVLLYVNGEPRENDFGMHASYWNNASAMTFALDVDYTVPQGKIVALGDNRNNSRDSRYADIGYVDIETELVGRADVFLEIGSLTEWIVELIYGVPFKGVHGAENTL